MPQIPNSASDDYGADDEVKEYKQEDDANSESGTAVDLVNDLKSDLIKKEAENSEENKSTSNASTAPFAQLINFTQTHLPPSSSRPQGYPGRTQSPDEVKRSLHRAPSTEVFHPPHHPYPSTAAQYQYAMYQQAMCKAERAGYYESPLWQPRGPVSSPYPPHYSTTDTATSAATLRLSHPSMDPRNAMHLSPAPPPNTTVINRPPHLAAGILSPSGPLSVVGGDNSVSGRDALLKSKLSHVKKPLNAFMLYMKDMRSKVVSECTLKESAAINQILGKRWHALDRTEQAKYYEMARKERALHMQLYPGWSARDNYAQQGKKKKRKRDKSQEITNPKKCRARYGLDRQHEWCKPCRRKKKCIRFVAGNNGPQDVSGSNASGATDTENVDTNTTNGTGHSATDGNCSSESET